MGAPRSFPRLLAWPPPGIRELIRRVASAIGDEGRAKYHAALRRKGHTDIYQGLTFWSPNINIFRDPRWGRGQETWGEDPFLTGEMGAAFVCGLQYGLEDGKSRSKYLKAAACAKHFAVHSGPEGLRHVFDARPGARDLHATYLPAFRKLVVEAGVEAVMGAYNRVYGEPACASQLLLGETLRGDWGFAGHVVSDCWALTDFHKNHQVTQDAVESAALALKSGCDMSCVCTYDRLGESIERGLITEADIDRSLARTLGTRFKLGMFDPEEQVPYASTPAGVVGCEAHRQLAYETAAKSLVLLKNRRNILPLGDRVRSMTVVGPNAGNVDVLVGNYNGINDTMTTVIEGIARRLPEGIRLQYRYGCPPVGRSENPQNYSVVESAGADVTIACMGLSPMMEGEEGEAIFTAEKGDRARIELPDVQLQYIRQIALSGGHVVLVLFGGSPIALGDVVDLVDAIVFAWYPGQEGGRAVADLLFGDVTPSGRLPITFPQSTEQLPPFEDYAMAGRTYRYMTQVPMYPFGFGLSYTQFAYSGLQLARPTIASGESQTARLTVTNSGSVPAEEVVQFYISDLAASTVVPQQSLVGFRRVHLDPGASAQLDFTVTSDMLLLVDDEGRPVLEPGAFRLTVGGCSPPRSRPPSAPPSPPAPSSKWWHSCQHTRL